MAGDGGLGLLAIPPEVFERIAQHADPKDLLSLRLVCKEAGARVFRTYTQAHFTERAFLVCSPESLNTLIEIAQSEVLGTHMKKLIFCLDEIAHPEDHRTLLRFRDPAHATINLPGEQTRFLRNCQDVRHKTAYDMQQAAIHSELDLHLLTTALCRLRQKELHLSVQIVETDATFREARYHKTLRVETGRRLDTNGRCLFRNAATVFDALALSSVHVDDLQITFSGWGVPLYELAYDETAFPSMKAVFANLRSLDMWVWAGSRVKKRDETRFAETLAKSSRIEHLKLHIYGCMQGPFLGEAFLGLSFSALKNFHLSYWTFSHLEMMRFLQRHPTLRQVQFKCCLIMVDKQHGELEELSQKEYAALMMGECDWIEIVADEGEIAQEGFWRVMVD